MKKHLVTTMAIAMFITTIAVASAHAQNGVMTVTIPFEFTVAGKTLPSGEYLVRMEDSRLMLKIQSRDNSKAAFVAAIPVRGSGIQDESKLVFNRYGNQHFLSQIWIAGSSTGEEMRKSAEERAIRGELAALKQKPERVTIAARSN